MIPNLNSSQSRQLGIQKTAPVPTPGPLPRNYYCNILIPLKHKKSTPTAPGAYTQNPPFHGPQGRVTHS